MTTLAVPLSDDALMALQQIAAEQTTTLEQVAAEVLAHYLTARGASRPYSFIGIGHSGRNDLSHKVEETLARAADRREGWSLEK